MIIDFCCAAQRGHTVLQELLELSGAKIQLRVFSFREEPVEPPFLDAIRTTAQAGGAAFFETRKVGDVTLTLPPPDLMLTVSWRYMIPSAVYSRARLGTFIFHDSLLPRYRGFSPTVWAIRNGERETGVTLFEIAETVDSGPIVAQRAVPIGSCDTIATVTKAVTAAYVGLLRSMFPSLVAGTAPRTVQDEGQATYCCKPLPNDARIDWSQPTARTYNLIRAFTRPYFGAFTTVDGKMMRVWSASLPDHVPHYVGRVPGRVVRIGDSVVEVLTGDGVLQLRDVQPDGADAGCPASECIRSLWTTLGT